MNDPTDETLLAAARGALAAAAPAAPSPGLLALVRREAAHRAARRRVRRAATASFAAAAAALALAVLPVRPVPPAAAPATADAALRLLLADAAEARALAETDGGVSEDDAAETDWDALSFSDALLAWQEAPLDGWM